MRYALLLTALTFACTTVEPETDVNRTGGVAEEGGGNPYDAVNPGVVEAEGEAGKADSDRYEVPELPTLVDPYIVVSLEGLTVELIDEATGFHKVYATGVGAKGRSGKSFTPTGSFRLHADPDNAWWFYKRRSNPSYFGGLPFLRFTAQNSRGYNTYGFHGPITEELIRGFVSHGCMRMRAEDIVEVFYFMLNHPGASVTIQEDPRFTVDGVQVDVTPADQDPVAQWRAERDVCVADGLASGAELAPGSHSLDLCEGTDRVSTFANIGDKVTVTATAGAPLDVALWTNDADEVVATVEAEAEGVYRTTAILRVGQAGLVNVLVTTTQPTNYDLEIAVEAFDAEG